MIKRLVLIPMMIITLTLMTGCFGGIEVNDRAFVQLMGIDKQDGVYLVTMQIYRSESGSSEPDTTKANSAAVSGKGTDISSAEADAELKTGKKLFLGHMKMLIIGKGIESPADELALFTDGSVSPSCPVVFSEDPSAAAGTLLEEGMFSAEHFLDLMTLAASQGKAVYTSLADITSRTGVMNCGAALPVIYADSEEKTVSFDGIVFADKNGTFGHIPEEDILGVKLLKNDFEKDDKIVVPISVNGRNASVNITGAKTCFKTKFSDGKLRVNGEIHLKLRTAENPYGILDETIEKAVRESVRDSCTSAYSTAVWYNSCDIFDIKKLVRKYCPENYNGYCGDQSKYLSESILTLKITSEIDG